MLSQERDAVSPIADRRRAFVAREIEQAALQLFDQRGFESVTVPEIAAAAGVSRSTFFRYFAGKEQVLHARSERLAARVVRALERRPAEESAFTAMCNAMLATTEIAPGEEQAMLTTNRVIDRASRAQQAGGELLRVMPPEITRLVAQRMGLDPATSVEPQLVGTLVWATAGVVTAHWVAQGGSTPLATMLQDAFGRLADGFGR